MTTEARLRLEDHQPDEARDSRAPASIDAKLSLKDDAVELHTDDGRSVWIELENDHVRVHTYNRSHEAPMNLTIPVEGEIEVDDHDYNQELSSDRHDTPLW
ncbi:hypothetical protein [Salipiger mucosus]|uniref:Uncharacterized protein n=1 Tax=Salipiger mucosus DSM 16094 TaxID=1123237 RepID=S9SCC7_9RHOB|nr:hypothetical protein [Salipiger mucosus]EPX83894.1 hypothetical protein Salmuc_01669 [Salipiger mucosus DSM 16094]